MTKEEAYRYIDNLKWLKGYDNTTIGGKTVGEILDEIKILLKGQEAVKPRRIGGKRNHYIKCGNCNYDLMTGFQFCPHCGHAVKWE